MTIRRQYSLPNCTLVLEGLSNGTAATALMDGRPLMSILVNAECHFVGSDKRLSGGRVFFENLVKAASAYAQECLSGLRHPQETEEGSELVHLEKVEGKHLHRLTWQPAADNNEQKVEIELTTVQLFDLVEAVDQFFADNSTLPDLSLELQPVSRRYRRVEEPLAKRVTPAALGMTSLALAGIAFFFVPVPEVREPEPTPQSSPSETVPDTMESPVPGASPTPSEPLSEEESSSEPNK
ncbi:MAG: DUF4335 domain-containing protein [Xenococcaceae cyanobacterium]